MSKILFCPTSTFELIDRCEKLKEIYEKKLEKGFSIEDGLLLVFDELIAVQTEKSAVVQKYKELLKEFQFNSSKMRKFARQDALIRFVIKDRKSRGFEEEETLYIIFNSYVLEDCSMRNVYKNL